MENLIDSIRPVCDRIVLWGKGDIYFPTSEVEENLLLWAGDDDLEHRWIHAQQILIYSIHGLSKDNVEEASRRLKAISFKSKL